MEVLDDCTFAASSPESRIGIRDSKLDNNASEKFGLKSTRLAFLLFIQVYDSSGKSYRVRRGGGARQLHICRLEPGIENRHSGQQIR